jgi:hypothetical protein
MVGLQMPRAIEILDATLRRLERGEMTALEAIDAQLRGVHPARDAAWRRRSSWRDSPSSRPGGLRLLLPAVARICLSNNAAERAVRAVALGRANWIFAGSDAGVQRAAAV